MANEVRDSGAISFSTTTFTLRGCLFLCPEELPVHGVQMSWREVPTFTCSHFSRANGTEAVCAQDRVSIAWCTFWFDVVVTSVSGVIEWKLTGRTDKAETLSQAGRNTISWLEN